MYGLGFRVTVKFSHPDNDEGKLCRGFQGLGLKGIQTPMTQGQSTKIISTIKWIRTSRLSIKNPLSLGLLLSVGLELPFSVPFSVLRFGVEDQRF